VKSPSCIHSDFSAQHTERSPYQANYNAAHKNTDPYSKYWISIYFKKHIKNIHTVHSSLGSGQPDSDGTRTVTNAFRNTHPVTWHHIPGDLTHLPHHCEALGPCGVKNILHNQSLETALHGVRFIVRCNTRHYTHHFYDPPNLLSSLVTALQCNLAPYTRSVRTSQLTPVSKTSLNWSSQP
jgi:hypothetical protein